ncbi:MAG: hypothetical protein Q9214_001067, partial [Letrouitia sp. 1 TL-2023]
PSDVQAFFKNKMSLPWTRFVNEVYSWMGLSTDSLMTLWQLPPNSEKKTGNQRLLPPIQMIEEYHNHQLSPGGGRLDHLTEAFVAHLNTRISWQSHDFETSRPYVIEASSKSATIDVLGWTSELFFNIMTKLYYGEFLLKSHPDMYHSFVQWEKSFWKLMYKVPRFMSKDLYTSRTHLVDIFTDYFRTPRSQRADANHFVSSAENELRNSGLADGEVARGAGDIIKCVLANLQKLEYMCFTTTQIDNSMNANLHKASFWMLAYIIHNPALRDAIYEETKPAMATDIPNEKYISENCPHLESTFYEILRLQTSSSVVRYTAAPTVIGGKVLRTGRNVIAPYRQLHYNEKIWGSDVAKFDPDCFLRDKSLSSSPGFRPFGGGVNICPGRLLAKRVVSTAVTILLHRFKIEGDETRGAKSCPRADYKTPTVGLQAPLASDLLYLKVTPLRRGKRYIQLAREPKDGP